MTELVQILLLGAALGGVYALMASGLTLIFGVMGIVNIAHAGFMLTSAYITYWIFRLVHVDPILSIVITMPIMFALGLVFYKVFFARIANSEKMGELSVLLTFALALILEGVLGFLFTNTYRSTSPDYATQAFLFEPFFIPKGQLYATLLSLLLLFLMWVFLRYSRTGNAIRATTQNRESARVVGVDVEWISLIVFGMGTALAGASGSLLTFLFSFYPGKHWEWIAILLSLIVLGGMGSMFGALIGSFILAIASSYVSFYFGPNWSPITFFLALFFILLVRPQGLLGKRMEA